MTPAKILAPMAGSVVQLSVAVGDAVGAGQLLLVLEAMKMEHEIRAGSDGQVVQLMVSVGDTVAEDEVLVLHSVGGGFGSSETSALIADDNGEAIRAQTVTIGELQTMARTERLCFKIDIEGY